jgi:hypothetical protein
MSKLLRCVIPGLLLVSSAFAIPLSFDFPLQAIASDIAPNATSYVDTIVTVFVTEPISTELVVSTVSVTLVTPSSMLGTTDLDLASTTTDSPLPVYHRRLCSNNNYSQRGKLDQLHVCDFEHLDQSFKQPRGLFCEPRSRHWFVFDHLCRTAEQCNKLFFNRIIPRFF